MRRKEIILKELILEYFKAAELLKKRSDELAVMMKKERDVFKLHELEKRRQLLDMERYEIMRDIRTMEEMLPEEEIYAEAV